MVAERRQHTRDEPTIKEAIRALLLREYTSSPKEQWYYISVVNFQTNTFVHGMYLKAHGSTDAWHRMHCLGWCPDNCETQTTGPINDEDIERNLPVKDRWRLLSREEIEESNEQNSECC